MFETLRAPAVALIGSLALAGCAGGNLLTPGSTSNISTASVPAKPAIDPACVTLAAQIDTLNKGGIAAKIEKAARRKYRLKRADLRRANELTKANADFRAKCSKLPQLAAAPASAVSGAAKTATSAAAGAAKTASTNAAARATSTVARTVAQTNKAR